MKAFADNKSVVAKMLIALFHRVENIVGKGENTGNEHFLLFPQCFQKVSFHRFIKAQDCVEKSLNDILTLKAPFTT